MAAAALCHLEGGDVSAVVHAFTLAIKNSLGLICDPIAGLVEGVLGRHVVLRVAAGLLIASAVFVVLVKHFSRERIRLGPACAGGLLFALLWTIASQLFGYYLRHIAQFSLLYGSLASLAVIVVWFFYAALVLLLCCEFTGVLHRRAWRDGAEAGLSPVSPGSAAPPAG